MLSPALFVLAMNVLSLMLNKAANQGRFKFHPGCEELRLTHFSFADDLLIFLDGTMESLDGVFDVLNQFEKFSGLVVNISKTSLFCSGVAESDLIRFKDKFGLQPQPLPIQYLGLTLCTRRLSLGDFDPLISQIRKNLNS